MPRLSRRQLFLALCCFNAMCLCMEPIRALVKPRKHFLVIKRCLLATDANLTRNKHVHLFVVRCAWALGPIACCLGFHYTYTISKLTRNAHLYLFVVRCAWSVGRLLACRSLKFEVAMHTACRTGLIVQVKAWGRSIYDGETCAL